MPTAPAVIDPVPTPVPTTDDPANFDARADALLAWFPDGVDQIQSVADTTYANAAEVFETALELETTAAVAADAAGLVAQSTSNLAVSAGAKTITFTTAKPLLAEVNRRLVAILKSDPSIRMFMTVATAPTSSSITATVSSGDIYGSGTYSSWQIMDAAFLSPAATVADIRAGTSDVPAVTPASGYSALAEVVLAYNGSNIVTSGSVLDHQAFINASVTLTKNSTLPNLTNPKVGGSGRIRIQQNGTGGWTLSYGTDWEFEGNVAPSNVLTASAFCYLDYDVVATNVFRARLSGVWG